MELLTMPENYIRRQKRTAFLIKNGYSGYRLACWYIGPETGRLIGIYFHEDERETVYTKSWRINEDSTFEHDSDSTADACMIYSFMNRSPETYCTEYMGYFIGTAAKPPAEPEGKVLPFPAKVRLPKSKTARIQV